jgi:hypothetical protein
MSTHYTIAIDNGTTGSIAILGPDGPFFDVIPTKEYLMGKAGKVVKRIDHFELARMIEARNSGLNMRTFARAYVERPFTGSAMMINTTVLAARSHEAVLIVLEQLGIGTQTVDSKEWQVPILGNAKGSPALKKASKLRGMALYPALAASINDHGDADSLLMAHHFHRNQ